MKQLIFTLLLLCPVLNLPAQTITLDFPHFAGQEWSFTAFRGDKQDTLALGNLDAEGRTTLRLPDSHKGFRGVTRWLLTKGGGLTIIFSGEGDFSVSCLEAQPSEETIIYKNTVENNYLNNRYKRQQEILGKIDVMRMAAEVYKDNNELLPVFNTELQKQEQAYNKLQEETSREQLYAARFAQIVDLTRGLPQILTSDIQANEQQMKDFIVNTLSFEDLYTSGHWGAIIEQWISWYVYDKDNHLQYLIPDAKHILSRTQSDEVYSQLAEMIIVNCEKQGWHDQEIELAFFLLNEDRVKAPAGKIASLYTLLKIRKGTKAPALTQGVLPNKKTILAFYDSGCGNCTEQMAKLIEQYPDIQKKGYEVVSFSADPDKGMFETYAEKLPWKSKYCDLKGFAGQDFRNYGVMGTPTFYILDAKGTVQGRYAQVEDMKL